MLISIVTQ